MKTFITSILILALCFGCKQRSAVSHTAFFNAHDAKAHLDSVVKSKGIAVGIGGSSYSLGVLTGEKSFQILIKGDDSIRNILMRDYKDFVEKELGASGVTINGRGVSGDVSGFDFDYHGAGVTGIVRVNSVLDREGFIQIDIFIYEHN